MFLLKMKFDNGKVYEEGLSLSETHKIPFQKDHTDFFMVNIDDVGESEVNIHEIRMINKCTQYLIRLSMLKFVS